MSKIKYWIFKIACHVLKLLYFYSKDCRDKIDNDEKFNEYPLNLVKEWIFKKYAIKRLKKLGVNEKNLK